MMRLGLVLCLASFVACWSNASAEEYKCTSKLDYDWPRKDSCWLYHKCKEGQEAPSTGWCFPLIRKFDRIDRKCTWWFRVDCSRDPGSEPQPTNPDVKPDTPDQKPETPEKTPETPEKTPETPEKKPETPEKTPETPDKEQEKPEEKPQTPEQKKEKPDEEKDEQPKKVNQIQNEPKTHPKLMAKIRTAHYQL